jgi:5-methylcytosine-specific restriction endonuclease McrA
MPNNARRTNGARRTALRQRILAAEDTCALCGKPVDKTIPYPQPGSPVIDEDIPIARGGSPYQRSNCHLMHRACNSWKATMTLTEARAKLTGKTISTNNTKAVNTQTQW